MMKDIKNSWFSSAFVMDFRRNFKHAIRSTQRHRAYMVYSKP